MFLAGVDEDSLSGDIPETVFILFQMTLAIITPALIVGSILGTLLAGIFASQHLGIFSGQGFADGVETMGQQLGVQITGIVAVFAYTAVVTFVLLKLVDVAIGLRVTKDEETEGLDVVLHNESGYDL